MKTGISEKAKLISDLERKLIEALAGQVHNYHFAGEGLNKASKKHLMGSGVVITLTVLGGRELIPPTLLRDGLSEDLIKALRSDFVQGFELATVFKPKAC